VAPQPVEARHWAAQSPDAQLQLGDRCEQVNFTVMSLASHNFDVVLGMPWLTHANPSIDWARRTLTLPPSQHHEPATILRLMKCKELKRAVRDQTLEVIMVLRSLMTFPTLLLGWAHQGQDCKGLLLQPLQEGRSTVGLPSNGISAWLPQ